MRCYLEFQCADCGNTTHRLTYLLGEHRGLPVVPVDVGESDRFECDRCGAVNVTGQLSIITEDDLDVDDDE